MRKAAVCNGDTTTTCGVVIAYSSSVYDNGRRVALDDDEATCGNCPGAHKILGTGKGISDKGRKVVVDGDLVRCPCGRNRVVVGDNPNIFLVTERGLSDASGPVGSIGSSALALAGFAEEDEVEQPHPVSVPEGKAEADCSYLNGSKARIDAPADLYRHVNSVAVGPGKNTSFDFPGGGKADATQYDATVNGHRVSIYVSTQGPSNGYGLPDESRVARALETVPPRQYKDLERISINSVANSQDVVWQKIYNDPSVSSAATASVDQGVAFFPWKGWSTPPQQYVDSTMLHETGHLWSEEWWKDPAKKQRWLDAIESDAQAPSQYARNNVNEDFAESADMYWSSKGTSCEVEGRKRYPARYGYFDMISE